MPKISRNSLGEYNKSCSTPQLEPSKIEFAIFRILYNFLENLQESAKWLYYWSFTFPHGPPEHFNDSHKYPSLALRPLGKSQSSHPYPPAAGWARRRQWPAGRPWPTSGAGPPRGSPSRLEGLDGVGATPVRACGGVRWWRPQRAAALARGDAMLGNERRCKPLRVLGMRLGWLESMGWRRRGCTPSDRQWRAARQWRAWEGQAALK
jgi:hypothetical protein